MNLLAAARLVVQLDKEIRQHPGDPVRPGSTRDKKARGRLNGALQVWEALTGEGIEYAREIAEAADRWREMTPGLDMWR